MYKNILVALDVDEPSSWKHAIPAARSLAQCFSADITLCSIVRDSEAAVKAQWSAIAYREMLQNTRAKLDLIGRQACGHPVDVQVGIGSISSGILDVADAITADLIVIASHSPQMKDYLFAAHGARVARRARCSVLVVRG